MHILFQKEGDGTMPLYIGGASLEEIAARVFDPCREVSEEEQLQRFWESLPWLVSQAVEALKRANFYRNFRVGCATHAFKKRTYTAERRWWTFTGSNIKIAPNSRPICAEQLALGAARSGGYDRIIGLVVCGTPQIEEGCAEKYPTLHPCKECRNVFKVSPEILDKTIVISITPDGITREVHTFKKLLQIHGEDGPDSGVV